MHKPILVKFGQLLLLPVVCSLASYSHLVLLLEMNVINRF